MGHILIHKMGDGLIGMYFITMLHNLRLYIYVYIFFNLSNGT